MRARRLAVHGGLVRPSVYLRRSKVTISLEPSIWEAFQEIAAEQGKTVNELSAEIERTRLPAIGCEVDCRHAAPIVPSRGPVW